jgi:hypothetical protein
MRLSQIWLGPATMDDSKIAAPGFRVAGKDVPALFCSLPASGMMVTRPGGVGLCPCFQ